MKRINKFGYIEIKTNEGWKLEHRLKVEYLIGRKLKSCEVVHHINENKQDNEIANLMLFKNQKSHSAWHNKVKQIGYLTQPMRQQIMFRWKEYINTNELTQK